jgi:hypothetical protein
LLLPAVDPEEAMLVEGVAVAVLKTEPVFPFQELYPLQLVPGAVLPEQMAETLYLVR